MQNEITEKIEHDKVMLSLVFISQIEEQMERLKINRAEVARRVGTSKAYLTQLWRGDKVLNMEMIARMQLALNIRFKIISHAE